MNSFYLDDIVVTATTTPTTLKKTNASVYVITKEEIERNHYGTLAEALEHVPGVESVKFAEGAGFEISGESSMTIRGSSNSLVVVDGVVQKQGNAFRNYLLHTNMDDIERIEVLKGAASTLYGADAVGGVVNIITKRDYAGEHGRIKASAGNFGQKNFHVNHHGGDEIGFWSLTYDKTKKGDYKDGYGVKTPRDIDADTVNLKLGAHLSKQTDFIFNFQYNKQDGSAVYDMPNWGKRYWTTDYTSKTFSGTLDYRRPDGKEANNFTILYGDWYSDRRRSSKGNQPAAPWEVVDRDNVMIVDRYYRQLSDNNRLAAGIEWQKYSVATAAAPNREIREQAAYLQDEWDITPKLNLTVGMRYVHSNSYKSQWLDSESLYYSFNDNLSLYISSSEFYKTPSTTAIFGSAAFAANPSIKPESGRSNEIGLKGKIGRGTQFDVALFDRRHENALVIDYSGPVNKYTNIDGVSHVKGAEFNVSQKLGKNVTARATFARLIVDTDTQIPRLPKSQFTFDINYNTSKFDIGLQALNRFDFAPNNYFPTGFNDYLPEKNYWVWNLSANYSVNKNLKVFGRINNIFDKGYMSATQYTATGATIGEPLAYYTAQGRSFIVGAEYSF